MFTWCHRPSPSHRRRQRILRRIRTLGLVLEKVAALKNSFLKWIIFSCTNKPLKDFSSSVRRSCRRAQPTTFIPWTTQSSRAIPSPIPALAPVTRATEPRNLSISFVDQRFSKTTTCLNPLGINSEHPIDSVLPFYITSNLPEIRGRQAVVSYFS